ncbi:MAG: integrase arm-type DNA-binding domain-containing protein [Luteibacter sp.]|uniref:integrase arm-type DNA-binding domain-containing protein n=1 Tax=Luteibacter sp. TaxID=1886636 RepID=UPI00280A47F2|nr:integrase arm-type DNA-binding domain-containing protein [Luteibacter sp.]MDQ7995184.1 integrase [Luteibacter sp.]
MRNPKDPKYRLSQAQLRALSLMQRPGWDAQGKTILEPNPSQRPYRFADGSQGAPPGFSIYVGSTGAFYEVRSRVGGRAVRLSLGSVQELSLAKAHELAAAQRSFIRETGQDPRVARKTAQETQTVRGLTVGQAVRGYVRYLEELQGRGKVKSAGVEGARDSLARLEREDVGLADRPIAALTDDEIKVAWNRLRHSAMVRSNRLPKAVKAKLVQAGEWWKLDRAALVSRLRLTGKDVELAYAAGMAAAEHTMGDASRAVERVLKQEAKAAGNGLRRPALVHNPFSVLAEEGLHRSTRELRKHYEAARVRNPLGQDDAATGQRSLPTVLKALLERRDMQNGQNATAVDYILLTLLWGTRRSESARLCWYESCSPEELDGLASWVWLAPSPSDKNPTTGLRGSQVFLHDTKAGEAQLMPVAYFAERVLRWRVDARKQGTQALMVTLDKARKDAAKVRGRTRDYVLRAKAEAMVARAEWRMEQMQRWVFPARNPKAVEGHYRDSKSILATIKDDAGLTEIGLTMHDFRRTMGRIAGKLLSGHMVSQLLRHHGTEGKDTAMAEVTKRYSEAEWPDLCQAMAKVDEAIVATSPRAWNMLRDPGDVARPRLDERDDDPLNVPKYRSRGGGQAQGQADPV